MGNYNTSCACGTQGQTIKRENDTSTGRKWVLKAFCDKLEKDWEKERVKMKEKKRTMSGKNGLALLQQDHFFFS
ncbi:Uncharacterized protein TCM_027172 [Theobroma cacao]|uniref:Uncharacterized protein n=1 Tax=Theobroma cacao TaxID=3641 RepID=A0A061GFJ7_THECC|nr:Uncharacterized protein TCM_027172 [Theobroma cacao]